MKYRSSLQHSSVKLLQNRSYFIKLDILAMPLGQSRSGYGLNFSGFILMIFFFFVWNVLYKAILLIKYRASNYCYTPAWYKMTLLYMIYSCDVLESPEGTYTFLNYPSTVWCLPNSSYILLTFIWWDFWCLFTTLQSPYVFPVGTVCANSLDYEYLGAIACLLVC